MYRQWGGDIINMSTIPEAKLAREAEISYALICTSTDYDAWREGEEPVTVEEVRLASKPVVPLAASFLTLPFFLSPPASRPPSASPLP